MRSLSTTLLLATTLFASAQQIGNGNFENWHLTPVYEDLDDWHTDNSQIPDNVPVTHVPGPGAAGSAVRLESHIYGTDSVFGYILAGEFVADTPTAGVLFGTPISMVKLDYRGEWASGDSALVFIGIWSGGVLASVDAMTVGTSDLAWSQLSFPVNGGVEILPDSLVFAITSSNPFSSYFYDGSWIEVDNVQLVGSSPFPDHLANANMEGWHSVDTWDLDQWSSFNPYLIGYGDTAVTPDPLAYDGNLSVRIETFQLQDDTLPGLLTNGTLSPSAGIDGGMPFNGSAVSLDGWFRYQPVGTDTARIVAFWSYTGLFAGVAEQVIVGGGSGWTAFSAPIFMPGAPDTLLITIVSGNNPGSVLQLDSLHLVGLTTGVVEVTPGQWHLDPNLATDLITLRTEGPIAPGAAYRVFDSMGREVIGTRSLQGPVTAIEVASLSPGRYWVEVSAGGERHPLAFIRR